MPIYEYRCGDCGHQQEFLQKVGDAPITVCTQCGKPSFAKMVTAAGFQLKGSGWYATDFKSKGSAPAAKPDGSAAKSDKSATPEGSSSSAGDSKPEAKASGHACGSGGCGSCS